MVCSYLSLVNIQCYVKYSSICGCYNIANEKDLEKICIVTVVDYGSSLTARRVWITAAFRASGSTCSPRRCLTPTTASSNTPLCKFYIIGSMLRILKGCFHMFYL